MSCSGANDLVCELQRIYGAGFGDPEESSSGDLPLVSTRWDSVLSAIVPSIVILLNTSTTLEIQYTANDAHAKQADKIGGRLGAGRAVTLDNFKGRLYCRATSGAPVVNFVVLPRNPK